MITIIHLNCLRILRGRHDFVFIYSQLLLLKGQCLNEHHRSNPKPIHRLKLFMITQPPTQMKLVSTQERNCPFSKRVSLIFHQISLTSEHYNFSAGFITKQLLFSISFQMNLAGGREGWPMEKKDFFQELMCGSFKIRF